MIKGLIEMGQIPRASAPFGRSYFHLLSKKKEMGQILRLMWKKSKKKIRVLPIRRNELLKEVERIWTN